MSRRPGESKPGLGANIIQALAKQLAAHISVLDGLPGTVVVLEHKQQAAGEACGARPPQPSRVAP